MDNEMNSFIEWCYTKAKNENRKRIDAVIHTLDTWVDNRGLTNIAADYQEFTSRKPEAFLDMTSYERAVMMEHDLVMMYPFYQNGLLPILVEAALLGVRPIFACEAMLWVIKAHQLNVDQSFIDMLNNPTPESDFMTLYLTIREDKGHFTFSDRTVEDLLETDLSKSITPDLFVLPFDLTYLRFGDSAHPVLPEEYAVYNSVSGVHALESCCILKYKTFTMFGGLAEFLYGEKKDVNELSVFSITMIGFPKSSLQDDAFHSFVLYLDPSDTETPLVDILEKHYEYGHYRLLHRKVLWALISMHLKRSTY
jgi:hypothetical protein